jgi:hypothetical protein
LPSTGTPQQISPAKILTPGQKWQFAEYAVQHAFEALDKLIHVMRHGQSETAVISASKAILDRALGTAPQNVDIPASRPPLPFTATSTFASSGWWPSDGPGGSGDALTGRCETLDGDGCRRDSHRAKVRDPDDQEDRHQTETAVAAMAAEAQAVSPGRAGVGSVQPRPGASAFPEPPRGPAIEDVQQMEHVLGNHIISDASDTRRRASSSSIHCRLVSGRAWFGFFEGVVTVSVGGPE